MNEILNKTAKQFLDEELCQYVNIAKEIQIRTLELEIEKGFDSELRNVRNVNAEDLSNDPRINYLVRLESDIHSLQKILSEEEYCIFHLRWIDKDSWEEISDKLNYKIRNIYRKRSAILHKYAKVKGLI